MALNHVGPNNLTLAPSGKNEGQDVPARSLPPETWVDGQPYECSLVKVPGGYLVSRQNRPAGIFQDYTRARAYIKARWPHDSVWIDVTMGRTE